LGRFLGVDPIVQFPTNSQSLNPYSYILNNPFAGTDPTGYEVECPGGTKGACTFNGSDISKIEVHKDGTVVAHAGGEKFEVGQVTTSNGAQIDFTSANVRQQVAANIGDIQQRGLGIGEFGKQTQYAGMEQGQAWVNRSAADVGGGFFNEVTGILDTIQALEESFEAAKRGEFGEAALAAGAAGASLACRRGTKGVCDAIGDAAKDTVGGLRRAGQKDAHHVIQDAAVRDLPGYNTNAAPGIQLPGPANVPGTPHAIATGVQRQAGGGTYGAERRIGYKAMRRAGVSEADARSAIRRADNYFDSLGVTPETVTRVPGNR